MITLEWYFMKAGCYQCLKWISKGETTDQLVRKAWGHEGSKGK